MRDLTARIPWEWRVSNTVSGDVGPWARNLNTAAKPFFRPRRRLRQVIAWTCYGKRLRSINPNQDYGTPDQQLPSPLFDVHPPISLERHGASYLASRLDLATGPCDLSRLFGPPRNHRECFLHGVFDLPQERDLIVHVSADWWMQWWCDGQPVFNTLQEGNRSPLLGRAHEIPLRLAAGRHVLVGRVLSGNGGWGVAAIATTGDPEPENSWSVEARRRFRNSRSARFVGLVYDGDGACLPHLNGTCLTADDPGMRYDRIPGISAARLVAGWNELHYRWSATDSAAGLAMLGVPSFAASGYRRRMAIRGRLLGITASAASFRGVPMVGWCSAEACAISCRTEVKVPVTLDCAGRRWTSPAGLTHRFVADDLPSGRSMAYTLRAGQGQRVHGRLCAIGSAPFTIGVIGDPSPCSLVLREAASSCAAAKPDVALLLGDLVSHGDRETSWVSEFTKPASRLCSRRPTFAVIGNHDEDSWLFDQIIQAPDGARNWQTHLGPLHLLGLDGLQDWSLQSANADWLDAALAASDAPFVIVCNHYPAWSSTSHGVCGPDGHPKERPVRQARQVILPICARHAVTAYFNGHAHCYERSEPPGQPPQITSGGAGGYLYRGSAETNPHSKVYVAAHHYCLLQVHASKMVLEARNLDHRRLDRVVMIPRRSSR